MNCKRWLGPLGLLVALAMAAWLFRPTVDFGAGASGIVVDDSGVPIAGVIVRFHSAAPIVSALKVVSAARTLTDEAGRFNLHMLSCNGPAGDYQITFEKEGFDRVVVKGRGLGRHRVVLKRHESSAA